jgi:hypothetical protein
VALNLGLYFGGLSLTYCAAKHRRLQNACTPFTGN